MGAAGQQQMAKFMRHHVSEECDEVTLRRQRQSHFLVYNSVGQLTAADVFCLAPDNALMTAEVDGQGSEFAVGRVGRLFDTRIRPPEFVRGAPLLRTTSPPMASGSWSSRLAQMRHRRQLRWP
jgi:hypothetical protein